ncbi:hypothetical protein Y032_0029g1993 [Ancylostoma ceylanicum]|uniref:Uncharacterized protein n=1 Tax=Ancylostoma ceylanicum TaxID=53326 RepID=A0A016US27_9BILA|nr:hypothetical protein Y032_0029g1993 [Ancylostoma ceylanicum]
MKKMSIVKMIRIDRHVTLPWIPAKRSSPPVFSRMCPKQTGDADDSKSGKDACRLPRLLDYHPSFVQSTYSLSRWRPPAVVTIATAAGEDWGYS